MALRRRSADAFSLFAFQDIITSVTGIMILLTLIFSLELTRRVPTTTNAPRSVQIADTQKQVDDLKNQIDELQRVFTENQNLLSQVASMPAIDIVALEQDLLRRLATLRAIAEEMNRSNQQLSLDMSQNSRDIEQLQNTRLRSLEEELRRLREAIATTPKSAVVVYNPDPGATKKAWLIDLGKDRIQAFPIDGGAVRTFPVSADDQIPLEFTAWARQRSSSSEYFVLLLRPATILLYDKVYPFLESAGFELGVDLIDSESDAKATLSANGQ